MARPLSEEARQKALDASQQVIADHGIERFTVDAVSKQSGVAKSTIYRHWPNGSALLIDSIGCMVTHFATPNTGSLHQDLRELMMQVLPVMADDTMRRTITGLVAATTSDPELSEIHQAMMRERMRPISTIVELAQARGEVRPDLDLALALDFVEGPLFFRTMVKGEQMTKQGVDDLVDLIVAGLTNI